MALIKEIVVDQITVIDDGQILCREVTRILEDGVIISKNYHRRVFAPGQVIEGDQRLKDIAAVVHTPQVIVAFRKAERQRQLE